MTTGAANDLAQALGWRSSLHAKAREARKFYTAIGVFTAIAVGLKFLRFNPMKALVWSGDRAGFLDASSLAPHHAHDEQPQDHGDRVNSLSTNVLGWTTIRCDYRFLMPSSTALPSLLMCRWTSY
jgi:hypothetical protein